VNVFFVVHNLRRCQLPADVVVTAPSRIFTLTCPSRTANSERTPIGSVIFLAVTWPERTPYATGIPARPRLAAQRLPACSLGLRFEHSPASRRKTIPCTPSNFPAEFQLHQHAIN